MTRVRIFVLAAVFVWACVPPALAEVKIGGIVFTDFYYLSENRHASGVGQEVGRTTIQVPNITRLYARWTNEDDVGMYIEFGMGQGSSKVVDSDDSGVNLRHA
jgi:hypothetical protein